MRGLLDLNVTARFIAIWTGRSYSLRNMNFVSASANLMNKRGHKNLSGVFPEDSRSQCERQKNFWAVQLLTAMN